MEDTRRIAKKPSRAKLNQIDRTIDALFNQHCRGIQISVLDIGKIFDAGRAVALAGGDVDGMRDAIVAKVAEVRKN